MFPYPSGRIHMGHVRNYTMGDVFARYKRAKGFNVLHPMGWDAFGMPAENAAMERKVHPGTWTYANIDTMRGQLKSMGLSLDWSREIATCIADYYQHQQKLFLDLLEKGLAYRKSSKVNWDPVDQTVLANEQVIDGRGWRSGALVEQRELTQWFFKITDYAEELLERLDTLDKWPEKVRLMQANWIGRSEGLLVRWALDKKTAPKGYQRTRGLYDAARHAVRRVVHGDRRRSSARQGSRRKQSGARRLLRGVPPHGHLRRRDRDGREAGLRHRHPRRASVRQELEAAGLRRELHPDGLRHRRHLRLPGRRSARPRFRPQIRPAGRAGGAAAGRRRRDVRASTDKAYRRRRHDDQFALSRRHDDKGCVRGNGSAPRNAEARRQAAMGKRKVNFRLRDWGISRQRYWGCPIPVIHCKTCGVVPVPEKDLPIKLPEDATFDKPGNPLERHPTWKHVNCPKCGEPATRETDTMDTFVDSSWYYVRFTAPDAATPVDSTPRTIGCRSISTSAASSMRFCTCSIRAFSRAPCAIPATCPSPRNTREPFAALFTQGMVTHETYKSPEGVWMLPGDVRLEGEGANRRAVEIATGRQVTIGATEKMSKSRKNLVDPDDIIAHYGADCARWFMLSDSPPERDVIWTEAGVAGAGRFIQRVWRIVDEIAETFPGPLGRGRSPLDRKRLRSARPPIARSIRSGGPSKPCDSTSPWRTSTSLPMFSTRP